MLVKRFLFAIASVGILITSHAQTVPDGRIPSDAAIRTIIAQRIEAKQGVGIIVGVIDPQGHRVIAYGSPAKGDPHLLNGDTIFEIGSVTKVFTSLLLADMVEHGQVSLTDP